MTLEHSVDLAQVADEAGFELPDLIGDPMIAGVRARALRQWGEGRFVDADPAP